MNILILNWKDVKNPEVGGAEIIAFEFARRLVKENHQITFFSRYFPKAKSEEKLDGVKIIRRGGKLTVYFQAFLYYFRLKTKPDLVIDMVNTICWQTPLYVPRKKRIAYVNQLAKEVLFYEFRAPLSWIAYFLEQFEYFTYSRTKFICYSASTKKDLMSFGVRQRNIRLFHLGLDHKRYFPGENKSAEPLFIFVARLVKMKRPELCIKAMKQVVLDHPTAKLAIIGNGPEEKRLESYIKKNSLQKNVFLVNKNNFFIDKNTKDVKIKLMQEAWSLLLPSVKEGWGMVVTEAAACGTPSIVSNVTGLRDSVVKDKSGLVLSQDPSDKELARAMNKLIEDKKLRNKLSQGAIKWAKDFNWDRSYEEFKQAILDNEHKK